MSLAGRERAEDEGRLDALQARDRSRDPASQAPRLDRDRLELWKEGAGRIGAIAHLPADRLRGDDAHRLQHAQLAGHRGRGKTGAPGDFAHVQSQGRIREEQSDYGLASAPEQCSTKA